MGIRDRRSLFCILCLGIGVTVLFLDTGAPHFFGDSIAVLWGRPHTWRSLLQDFVRLDGGHWFRPLSNSLPPFLMWPWFGTSFQPYHVFAILLHLALSLGLFALFIRVFRDRTTAFVAAAFFAFHPVQFYATYDIAFYQEPITAGLELAALVLFIRYVDENARWLLGAALSCAVLALCSKETAVMLPGALLLVLGGRISRERRAGVAFGSAVLTSAAFTVIYAGIMGVVFRYQDTYRPRWELGVVDNLSLALRWAFGLPAGWQTAGWQHPAHVDVILWSVLFSLFAVVLLVPRSGLWRGPAFFLITAFPAFLTQHLLPHHIYFPLIGIAYLVGGAFALVRARVRWLAAGAAAAVVSSLFIAAFLSARNDAVVSWVGRSAWQVHSVSEFVRASGLRLTGARGLVVRTGKAPHLSFDWMSGDIFNLFGDENLEVRVAEEWPPQKPEGFYLLEYRDDWLWNRTPSASLTALRPSGMLAKPVPMRLDPTRVRPGEDSYCLEIPALSGQLIDVKYRYNQRFPRIAYEFTRLNRDGKACLSPAANVPWGTFDVVAARPSGSLEWASVQGQLQVLP
jgi:hypothetical protein